MTKFLTMLSVLLVSFNVAALEIKTAIIAPDGSVWMNVMRDMDKALRSKTNGRVGFTFYAGGSAGDEKDVIRKINIGQMHAGAFTGVGLGAINSSVRILELPLLFDSYKEVDYVTAKLQPELEKGFDEKGYILLGWAEAGFVNIFSNTPIRGQKDMQGVKMWAWEGDPLVKAMYDGFDIVPVPLSLVDVMTALQTGMINAVYVPPLGAIAMQWHAKTKYVTNIKLADSTGALLISKKEFNKIAPADRKILRDVAGEYCKKLVQTIRRDNEMAVQALKNQGLKFVEVSKEEKKNLLTVSEGVWKALSGKLYSPELLANTKKYLEESRK